MVSGVVGTCLCHCVLSRLNMVASSETVTQATNPQLEGHSCQTLLIFSLNSFWKFFLKQVFILESTLYTEMLWGMTHPTPL
jgi:hypothetical protein